MQKLQEVLDTFVKESTRNNYASTILEKRSYPGITYQHAPVPTLHVIIFLFASSAESRSVRTSVSKCCLSNQDSRAGFAEIDPMRRIGSIRLIRVYKLETNRHQALHVHNGEPYLHRLGIGRLPLRGKPAAPWSMERCRFPYTAVQSH